MKTDDSMLIGNHPVLRQFHPKSSIADLNGLRKLVLWFPYQATAIRTDVEWRPRICLQSLVIVRKTPASENKMSQRIFSIALLLALSVATSGLSQTVAGFSSAAADETEPSTMPEVIYVPSPFAEPFESIVIRERGVPMENQPRAFRQVQDQQETLEDANGLKKFVIESWTLGIDGPSAEEILKLVDASTLQVDDDVITAGTISSLAGNSGNADETNSIGPIETRSPTTSAKITESQFSRIRDMIGSSIENNISSATKSIVFENQQATISDAGAVPFMVATRPGPDGQGGFRNVPVVQTIEDGIIFRHRANATEAGVQLNSQIILNDIYRVDKFTFSSNSNLPVTIQIPRCRYKRLDCSMELHDGDLMLIDANFSADKNNGTESVNRFLKNPQTENEYATILFVLKAKEIK